MKKIRRESTQNSNLDLFSAFIGGSMSRGLRVVNEVVVEPQAVGGDRQIVVHGLNRQNTAAPAEFPYVFDNEHSRGAAPNAIHHDVAEMLCSEGVVISAGLLQRHFSIQDRYSDGRSR
jgi:hypothetical protein